MNKYNDFIKNNYCKVNHLPNKLRFAALSKLWNNHKKGGKSFLTDANIKRCRTANTPEECFKFTNTSYRDLECKWEPNKNDPCMGQCRSSKNAYGYLSSFFGVNKDKQFCEWGQGGILKCPSNIDISRCNYKSGSDSTINPNILPKNIVLNKKYRLILKRDKNNTHIMALFNNKNVVILKILDNGYFVQIDEKTNSLTNTFKMDEIESLTPIEDALEGKYPAGTKLKATIKGQLRVVEVLNYNLSTNQYIVQSINPPHTKYNVYDRELLPYDDRSSKSSNYFEKGEVVQLNSYPPDREELIKLMGKDLVIETRKENNIYELKSNRGNYFNIPGKYLQPAIKRKYINKKYYYIIDNKLEEVVVISTFDKNKCIIKYRQNNEVKTKQIDCRNLISTEEFKKQTVKTSGTLGAERRYYNGFHDIYVRSDSNNKCFYFKGNLKTNLGFIFKHQPFNKIKKNIELKSGFSADNNETILVYTRDIGGYDNNYLLSTINKYNKEIDFRPILYKINRSLYLIFDRQSNKQHYLNNMIKGFLILIYQQELESNDKITIYYPDSNLQIWVIVSLLYAYTISSSNKKIVFICNYDISKKYLNLNYYYNKSINHFLDNL